MAVTGRSNLLLEVMSMKDRNALISQGESVELVLDEVLCEANLAIDHVYFPVTGFISLVAAIEGRPPLETGLIGNEGMLGATLGLDVSTSPVNALVQGSGSALRLTGSRFRRSLREQAGLRRTINRYLYVLIAQQSRAITCTHFHEVEARLARWLLMIHDRTSGDQLQLTHSFLASMLGVQRSAVTIAAGHFQKNKLISYSRGEIMILDRVGLEQASCECYVALLADYTNQFAARTNKSR
jgi:CRP-like cAMP-binding protein